MQRLIRNWFSNFEPFEFPYKYQGITYKYPETFYQAMKTTEPMIREMIAKLKPWEAKKFWKLQHNKELLRKNWRKISLPVVDYIIRVKFQQDTKWYMKLKRSKGDIVEWNNWHDNFYGVCICASCERNHHGENNVGLILMKIRDEPYIEPLKNIFF